MSITINKTSPIPKLVNLKKWCELTGETKQAVYQRLSAGKWIVGIHVTKPDNRIWVNYREAQKWLMNPNKSTHQALKALK